MSDRGEPKREARVLLATWAVLVALTVGSFWLAESRAAPASGTTSGTTVWVLALATLKCHLIAAVFMEMRRSPRAWAGVMSGFLIAEATLIVAILS